jgi:hypothetical protein
MKKLIALGIAGVFLGAASITAIAAPAHAQSKKEMSSICDTIKDKKRKAACLDQEAEKAAEKKIKGTIKK